MAIIVFADSEIDNQGKVLDLGAVNNTRRNHVWHEYMHSSYYDGWSHLREEIYETLKPLCTTPERIRVLEDKIAILAKSVGHSWVLQK